MKFMQRIKTWPPKSILNGHFFPDIFLYMCKRMKNKQKPQIFDEMQTNYSHSLLKI